MLISGIHFFAFAQNNADKIKTGRLILQYENLNSSEGNVVVKLYNNQSPRFPHNQSAIAIKTVKIEDKQATVTFDNLPYGKYAFTTFHDKNSNGVMETNLIHVPLEGYAFSNNLKIVFGPPSFEKASFELQQATKNMRVIMSY